MKNRKINEMIAPVIAVALLALALVKTIQLIAKYL
jgi:hypothetical protein